VKCYSLFFFQSLTVVRSVTVFWKHLCSVDILYIYLVIDDDDVFVCTIKLL